MSYEYLSDTFGELRSNRKTPYTPIEKKAIQWMMDFVEKRRSGIDFANEFNVILDEFSALFKEIGHFDEDTPLWLNTIGGLHFPRWYQYQQIYWYLHDHYDELTENQLKNYEQIQEMDIDEEFRKIYKTCLAELNIVSHPSRPYWEYVLIALLVISAILLLLALMCLKY